MAFDYAGTPYPAITDDETLSDIKAYTEAFRAALITWGVQVFRVNGAFKAADAPGMYPRGIYVFYGGASDGWPFTYCGIKTEAHHSSGYGTYQTCTDNLTGVRKARTARQVGSVATWSAWKDVYTP